MHIAQLFNLRQLLVSIAFISLLWMPSKAQHLPDSSTKLMHELMGVLEYYLQPPLFECTSYPLGEDITVQFFLNPACPFLIQSVRTSAVGDTLWLEFVQELTVTEGRIDWGKNLGFIHFGHHEEYSPRLAFLAKIFICVKETPNTHLHSGHRITWLGQRTVKALHHEIDLPTIAGKAIQDTLNQIAQVMEELITLFPQIVTGKTISDWSHSLWALRMAEMKADSFPLDVRAHRKTRIQTKKRRIEGFDLTGRWKLRIVATPDHGAHGDVLLDAWVDFLPDNRVDYHYEIIRVQSELFNLKSARAWMEHRIRIGLAKRGVHDIFWSLSPADPPFDYALHLKADNPNQNILVRMHVFGPNEFVAVLVNKPDRLEMVRVKRVSS